MDDGMMKVIWAIIGALCLAMLLPSEPKKKEEICDFCKEGSALIAYREMEPGDRKVAKFCPICGRKLGE